MKNEILMRRFQKVIVHRGMQVAPKQYLLGMLIEEFEKMGYRFSWPLLEVLGTLNEGELKQFYEETMASVKKLIGADRTYNVMYTGFPKQVKHITEIELYINAYLHYLSKGKLYPKEDKGSRKALSDHGRYKIIGLATEEEWYQLFIRLMQSKTSISPEDAQDLAWFIQNEPEYRNYIPKDIPFKENAVIIAKGILDREVLSDIQAIKDYIKTATDVLRLITAMSDGDISLSRQTQFRSFKRRERRLLLELLEGCHQLEEDMIRYKNKWIRIGERLHPGEYAQIYPNTARAFEKLRNNEKIWTYNGKVNEAIKRGEEEQILRLLKQRPGEFARRLDAILRQSKKPEKVLLAFEQVVTQVASPIILQIREHFMHREVIKEERFYFPKGVVSKTRCIRNPLPEIELDIRQEVVAICEKALIEIYRQRPALGKVYLGESYKRYKVPFSQRTASKTLETVPRGSKFKIRVEENTLRNFIWWRNEENHTDRETNRTDVDLSMTAYSETWDYITHISYTNLREERVLRGYHSGDIVDAPEGASEFIDIDLAFAKKSGVRYIVASVQCFTGQKYCDLPECFMGWMNREKPESGEIYEPKLVENKVDIASSSPICIPYIIDLKEEVLIWADMMVTENLGRYMNIEDNQEGILLACKSITKLNKPNLYDLIELHIKARGYRVSCKEEANYIFDEKDGIRPSQIELFMAEYL